MEDTSTSFYSINHNFYLKMTTVTIPSAFENEIKALIRAGLYRNKGELIKDALINLFQTKPDLRLNLAIEMYKNKELSIGRAAEMAGLNIIQFREILSNRGFVTEVGSKSVEELDNNVKKLKKLKPWFYR